MIRAGEADRPALEALLRTDPRRAMFPLANLAGHGLTGTGHPKATTFWIDDAAAPGAVLGITEGGMAFPIWDDDFDARRAARALAGRRIRGLAGPSGPVRSLMAAAGLTAPPGRFDADEPHFALDLARLRLPGGPGQLARIDAAPDVAGAWRAAYLLELHMGRGEPDRTAAEVADWIAQDSHRLLILDGQPAALTGFNARLPDIVQVGGVYVPPEARGRGLARRAVGLHLEEARREGVSRATLFSTSPAAAASYTALGFERIGEYALVILGEPEA